MTWRLSGHFQTAFLSVLLIKEEEWREVEEPFTSPTHTKDNRGRVMNNTAFHTHPPPWSPALDNIVVRWSSPYRVLFRLLTANPDHKAQTYSSY